MPSWLDTLLPASFGGVDFLVESGSGGQMGRRFQLTNYPFSDHFDVDDMGKLNAPFNVRGFILDNDGDLHSHHAALEAALNSGLNTLVHPRLGRMQVLPGQCSYTFQGSRVRYTLQFLPPEDAAPVSIQEETSANVDAACTEASAQVEQKAVATIDTSSRTLLDDAVASASSMLSTLRDVNGQIDAAIAPVAALAHSIDMIADQAVKLILQPLTFFNEMRDVYYSVLNAADDIDSALNRYRDLKFTPSIDDNAVTPTQIARNGNRAAMASATNAALLVETVRLVALSSADLNVTSNDDSPFDSYPHATTVRDELVAELDELASTLDAEAFDALIDLRAKFYRHIDAHGMRLPRVKLVKYGVALPAWVIAHEVYGNANLMNDLVRRNSIAQPAYIAAGTALEILAGEFDQ